MPITLKDATFLNEHSLRIKRDEICSVVVTPAFTSDLSLDCVDGPPLTRDPTSTWIDGPLETDWDVSVLPDVHVENELEVMKQTLAEIQKRFMPRPELPSYPTGWGPADQEQDSNPCNLIYHVWHDIFEAKNISIIAGASIWTLIFAIEMSLMFPFCLAQFLYISNIYLRTTIGILEMCMPLAWISLFLWRINSSCGNENEHLCLWESWHAGLLVFAASFGFLGITSILIDAIWGDTQQDSFDKKLLELFSVRVSHVATTYIWSYFLVALIPASITLIIFNWFDSDHFDLKCIDNVPESERKAYDLCGLIGVCCNIKDTTNESQLLIAVVLGNLLAIWGVIKIMGELLILADKSAGAKKFMVLPMMHKYEVSDRPRSSKNMHGLLPMMPKFRKPD